MKYEIKNPKKINRNTLKGFFTLAVGPLEIEGYSYHTKNEKAWVNPPSREYQDKETGETKYAPMVRISEKERYYAFQKWACEECAKVFNSLPEGG
jgi:hypothetical protein